MSIFHQVVLQGDSISIVRKRDFSPGVINLEKLAEIREIKEEADGEAVIVLQDGSLRKIVEYEGLNPFMLSAQERDDMAEWFAQLSISCDSELQILCLYKALQPEKVLECVSRHINSKEQFLLWWHDYHAKWFTRVSDLYFLPQRKFYVVIGVDPEPVLKEQKTAARLSELLKQRLETLLHSFASIEIAARVLNRSQVRHLLQSCINPCVEDLSRVQEIPEYESASSLCVPSGMENAANLQIGNSYVSTLVLSMLPKQVYAGWTLGCLSLNRSNLLCLHLRPIKESDKPTRVGMSYLFTLWDTTLDGLDATCAKVRQVFTAAGAILDKAETWQSEAWASFLPLGRNRIPMRQNVEAKIAGTCYPYVDSKFGAQDGLLLGFSLAGRDPILFDPFDAKQKNRTLLILGDDKQKSRLLNLLLMRLLPTGAKVRVVHELGEIQRICNLLGPELSQSRALSEVSELSKLKTDLLLEVFNTKKALLEEKSRIEAAVLKQIANAVKDSKSNQRLIIVVSEIVRLSADKKGRKVLAELIELSELLQVSVIVASSKIEQIMEMPTMSAFLKEPTSKIMLPTNSKSKLKGLKALGLGEQALLAVENNVTDSSDSLRFLLNSCGKSGMVNCVLSPQEYWLCSESAEDSAKIKKRMRMIKADNPGINNCDSLRQAVYYLALEKD